MTLHKSTAKAASILARLRASQASLELKAKQLAARKSEVESKTDRLGRSLKRTIDTREKIVLGALMKMVGLDRFTIRCRNDNQSTTMDEPNGNVMTQYDIDLLVGVLFVASEQMNGNDTATLNDLREKGSAIRRMSKVERVKQLSS